MAIDKGLKGIVIGLGTGMLWYIVGAPTKIDITLSDFDGDGVLDFYIKQQSHLGFTWQCKAYLSREDKGTDAPFEVHDLLQEPKLRSELERKIASETNVFTMQTKSPLLDGYFSN